MKKLFKQLFSRQKWYEQVEYSLLLLMAVATPLYWRLAIVGMILLTLSALTKAIVTHHFGNPALGKRTRWCLVVMIAFFAVYLVSGFFSHNRAYGLEIAMGKICFLLIPLTALISDTRYLSRLHFRTLFYALFSSLAVTFIVCAVIASVKMIGGSTLNQVLDYHFFPTHHTYMALYITVAMAFGYTEILRHLNVSTYKSKDNKPLPLWFLMTGELLLTLFAMAVNSRAGILVICLMAVAFVVDIAFLTRRWKTTLATFLLMAGCAAALYVIIPDSRHRLSQTAQDFSEEYPTDARVSLNKYGMEVIEWDMDNGRWLVGLGEGDYLDHINVRYAVHGYKTGVSSAMGTHNQYLETFLSCGAVGLIIMLLMLLLPLFPARPFFQSLTKHRDTSLHPADLRIAPAVVLSTMIILSTESMLGRQMGLLFIAYYYLLTILWTNTINLSKR